MNVVHEMTARKKKNQNQISTLLTKTRCLFKKIITKSNSHQIKPKQKQVNLCFNRKDMGSVLNATG